MKRFPEWPWVTITFVVVCFIVLQLFVDHKTNATCKSGQQVREISILRAECYTPSENDSSDTGCETPLCGIGITFGVPGL